MTKYPYIANKALYAATMGACSYIREKGWFNKAVSFYARKYNVSESELAHQIRLRQAAGQRSRSTSETQKRKYKYFLVARTSWCEAVGETNYSNPQIVRGFSKNTVSNRLAEQDERSTIRSDTGSAWSQEYGHAILAEYDTKQEAEYNLQHWNELVTEYEKARLENMF